MLPIRPASIDDRSWRGLTPPSLLAQILARAVASSEAPIIRVATLFGEAAACGVALPEADGSAELLLLVTSPGLRRRGIAAALLTILEDEAIERGLHTLTASWSEAPDHPGAMGALLTRAGWPPPQPSGIAMTLPAAQGEAFVSQLAARLAPCPFHFIGWGELDDVQRHTLQKTLAESDALAGGLDPFRLEDRASPDLSFAVAAADGRIVGWHIATWATPQRAWVLASYGLAEALGGSCFLRLWALFFGRAARRAADTPCGWDTHVSLGPMMRFLQGGAAFARQRQAIPGLVTQARWSSQRPLRALQPGRRTQDAQRPARSRIETEPLIKETPGQNA